MLDLTLSAKFMARVHPEPNSGCWLWTGDRTTEGYGVWRGQYAHRLAYQSVHGHMPPDSTDHLCSVKGCVNPQHLEAVSRGENVRRATLKALCPWGHGAKVRMATGQGYCRTCSRKRARLYYDVKKPRVFP